MRHLVATVLVALLTVPATPAAQAPQLRPGLLVGRITDPGGAEVGEAVLRATQGAKTIIATADRDGDFRIAGLTRGSWTIAIRRLGYRPVAIVVDMPAEGLRRNFTLEQITRVLDAQLVSAKWTGVRGLVGDARSIAPLAGARVRLLGSDVAAGTDSLGNFALPFPGGREIVLRVERTGFMSRVISVTVPEDSYVDLEVALDTTLQEPKDLWVYRDLDQRLKFATPRAVQISRDEIEATDAVSLGDALLTSRSVAQRNVVINSRACLFVNGVARPGFPVNSILAGEVEFVEAYPPGSDLTRTLALKWPPGGVCGQPDGSIRAHSAGARQVVQFVSVWLKQP